MNSMQEMQMRMEMKVQFGIMKNCFVDCVTNFRDDALTSNEKSCLQNCAGREMQAFQSMAQLMQSMEGRSAGLGGGPSF